MSIMAHAHPYAYIFFVSRLMVPCYCDTVSQYHSFLGPKTTLTFSLMLQLVSAVPVLGPEGLLLGSISDKDIRAMLVDRQKFALLASPVLVAHPHLMALFRLSYHVVIAVCRA